MVTLRWPISSITRSSPKRVFAHCYACAAAACRPSTDSQRGSFCCIFQATRSTSQSSYPEDRTQPLWPAFLCATLFVTKSFFGKRPSWSQRWLTGHRSWLTRNSYPAGCFPSSLYFHRCVGYCCIVRRHEICTGDALLFYQRVRAAAAAPHRGVFMGAGSIKAGRRGSLHFQNNKCVEDTTTQTESVE